MSHSKTKITFAFITLLLVFLQPVSADDPFIEDVVLTGQCRGTASPPAGHCTTGTIVNNCRCGGPQHDCGPTGSYYCETNLGKKIRGTNGSNCSGTCTWSSPSPAPEPEPGLKPASASTPVNKSKDQNG